MVFTRLLWCVVVDSGFWAFSTATNLNKLISFSLQGTPIPPQPTVEPLINVVVSDDFNGVSLCVEDLVRNTQSTMIMPSR